MIFENKDGRLAKNHQRLLHDLILPIRLEGWFSLLLRRIVKEKDQWRGIPDLMGHRAEWFIQTHLFLNQAFLYLDPTNDKGELELQCSPFLRLKDCYKQERLKYHQHFFSYVA